jgi:DNA-binding response OmpR family regulator
VATSARILVIEDSRLVGEILTCALEQEGCTAFVARTAAQGIDLAQRIEPDLILADLGVGGDVVAALSQVVGADVPIIVISASGRNLAECGTNRVARVFGEPFYPAEVAAAAVEALQSPARLSR